MKKLYIIFLFILAFNVSYAFILPEEEIKKIARDLHEKNNGEYTCYSKGRTITFEYFLKSFEDFKRFNQNSNVLVGNLDDDIAGICSSNFINLNYIVHYKNPDGSTSTKMSFLSPTDLLGFKGANKERISLLNHNKSRGVNISLLKTKGWIIEEGDRPHIVQKYINPGRTTIYMV